MTSSSSPPPGAPQSREMWLFGPFRIDTQARVVFRGDTPVELTPKQVDTLMVLVREHGQVVERERLIEEVWRGSFVEESGLTRNISALRKALTEGNADIIETIPKRGYRFVAPVVTERVPVQTPQQAPAAPAQAPSTPDPGPATRRPSVPRGMWVGIPLLLLIAAVMAVMAYRGGGTAPAPRLDSVAVLPFRLVSPDAADQYLTIGLADLLTTRLAGMAGLNVRSVSSTQAFAGVDAVAAGQELGVDAVIDGSLRRDADRLRLTVRVVEVRTGLALFAGSFDERATDVLTMENALTDAVLGLLVPRLSAADREARARAGSTNPQAVDEYLRGRYLWSTRQPADVEAAIIAFERAIALDPSFALAYAGLAHAYIIQGDYQYRWPRDVFPKAKVAAVRALELDGTLADAHAALGEIAWEYDWDFTAAEASLTRAAALAPNDATAHQWLAEFHAAAGRTAQSDAAIEKAILLAPRDFAPTVQRVILRYWSHRFDEVIQLAGQTDGLGDAAVIPLLYKHWALYCLGRFDEAEALFRRLSPALQSLPLHPATNALYAFHHGRKDEAVQQMAAVAARRQSEYVEPIILASGYLAIGDREEAMRWLNQAVEDRSSFVPWVPFDPFYATLRDDPRFRDLLRRAGLADSLIAADRVFAESVIGQKPARTSAPPRPN